MFKIGSCRSISRCLWDYAAYRLPEVEMERVERHLQECARCCAEFETYRQSVTLIEAGRNGSIPESRRDWSALRGALETQAVYRAPWPFLRPSALRPVAAAAAVALLFAAHELRRAPLTPRPAESPRSSLRIAQAVKPQRGVQPPPDTRALPQRDLDRLAMSGALQAARIVLDGHAAAGRASASIVAIPVAYSGRGAGSEAAAARRAAGRLKAAHQSARSAGERSGFRTARQIERRPKQTEQTGIRFTQRSSEDSAMPEAPSVEEVVPARDYVMAGLAPHMSPVARQSNREEGPIW